MRVMVWRNNFTAIASSIYVEHMHAIHFGMMKEIFVSDVVRPGFDMP